MNPLIESQKEKLVIVMPTYNEEGCITDVCTTWLNFLRVFPKGKLLVVNDGSKDKTGVLLDALAAQNSQFEVVHQKNQGHGGALLNGYQRALTYEPDWVFQVDSDDQFIVDDFWTLWKAKAGSPFITGFRKERHDALHRLLITRILRFSNFLFFGVWIKDANIPYRLISGPLLKKMLQQLPSVVFAPNIFLAVLAAKAGFDLKALPVQHHDRKTGQVSIIKWKLVKVCLRCVKELLVFRWTIGKAVSGIRAA